MNLCFINVSQQLFSRYLSRHTIQIYVLNFIQMGSCYIQSIYIFTTCDYLYVFVYKLFFLSKILYFYSQIYVFLFLCFLGFHALNSFSLCLDYKNVYLSFCSVFFLFKFSFFLYFLHLYIWYLQNLSWCKRHLVKKHNFSKWPIVWYWC